MPLFQTSTQAWGEAATQSASLEQISVQNPIQSGHIKEAHSVAAAHGSPTGAPPACAWRQWATSTPDSVRTSLQTSPGSQSMVLSQLITTHMSNEADNPLTDRTSLRHVAAWMHSDESEQGVLQCPRMHCPERQSVPEAQAIPAPLGPTIGAQRSSSAVWVASTTTWQELPLLQSVSVVQGSPGPPEPPEPAAPEAPAVPAAPLAPAEPLEPDAPEPPAVPPEPALPDAPPLPLAPAVPPDPAVPPEPPVPALPPLPDDPAAPSFPASAGAPLEPPKPDPGFDSSVVASPAAQPHTIVKSNPSPRSLTVRILQR